MAVQFRQRDFQSSYPSIQQGLFIFLDRKHIPSGVSSLNVGLQLSAALVAMEYSKRADKVTELLKGLINTQGSAVFLENIDILFDPSYGTDVIKQLLLVGRNRKLLVLWPGSLAGQKLVYAADGYLDYREFDLGQYIDTYVIMK